MTARARIWKLAPWAAAAIPGALMAHFAMRVHTLQPDEVIPVAGSRYVLDHPLSAIDPGVNVGGRGFERLIVDTFAALQWILGDTARAFAWQHVLSALLFALVVPAVAGWARELGLLRWQAVAAGLMAGCVPWMVLGTSFLNSAPAYAFTVLALWAMWRGIVRPSLARDLIALAALLLLAVSRVGNVVVAAGWPLAIVAFTLCDRPPGATLRAALRGLPARVWREHRLLVVLGTIGVLALVIGGTQWLIGGYPVRAAKTETFRAYLRVLPAFIAVGTGMIPVVLALAWAARSVFAPRDAGAAAVAWLGIGAFLAFVYVAATQGPEERYIAPLAPMLILMAAVALARREVGPVLVLASGLLIARAIAVTGVGLDNGPYGFFASPAQTFFRRIVLGKASLAIPFTNHHVLTTVVLAAVVIAVVAVALARRRPQLVYGAVAVGVIAYGLAAGLYAMNEFSKQAGYPDLRFSQQAWIDGAVGTDADVALAPQGLEGVQRELGVFNRSLGNPYAPSRATDVRLDPRTGAVDGLPRYLVVQDGILTPLAFTGGTVAQSTYLPVQARLLEVEPRTLWHLRSPRSVRVFATNSGECLSVTLTAPAGTTKAEPFVIGSVRGSVDATPTTVAVPLRDGRRAVDLRVRGGGGATISALGRGACP